MSSCNTCSSSKKRIAVMIGIHGSGKTTLGRKLQSDGYDYFPEIGTALRARTSQNVSEDQKEFDHLVLEKEIQRDYDEIILADRPVIETWHIGNYAFAKARKSFMDQEYHECFAKQLQYFYPLIIRLKIDDDTFLFRNTEKNISPSESLHFYRRVEQEQNRIIACLQSAGLVAVSNYECSYDYNTLIEELSDFMKIKETRHGTE